MQNNLIFDVGCHIGEDTEFYLKKGFTVVAVEANPALCSKLKERFAEPIAARRLKLVEAAIAPNAGTVEFFINTTSIWGTIDPHHAGALGQTISSIYVPAIQFGTLIKEYGTPRYLKIDIEGTDTVCLEALLETNARPQFISVESNQASLSSIRRDLHLLRGLGYHHFAVVDQSSVRFQRPPAPAREGLYVSHSFELGASGLFGMELPGPWMSASAVFATYAKIFCRNKLHGLAQRIRLNPSSGGHWYDTHASLTPPT